MRIAFFHRGRVVPAKVGPAPSFCLRYAALFKTLLHHRHTFQLTNMNGYHRSPAFPRSAYPLTPWSL
jgi:hypothetical protein